MTRLKRLIRSALIGGAAGTGGVGATQQNAPAALVLTQEDVRVRDILAEWRKDEDMGLLYTIPWRALTDEERTLTRSGFAAAIAQHDAAVEADLKVRGFAPKRS